MHLSVDSHILKIILHMGSTLLKFHRDKNKKTKEYFK